MGLLDAIFGKKPLQGREFSITQEDKKWVDSCYRWLLATFGHPDKNATSILFTKVFFPITYEAREVTVGNLLQDLCNLYFINPKRVSLELIPDIRDIANTPHQIQGRAFESELEIVRTDGEETSFVIHIANSLVHREYLLLRRLILELTKIKIYEKEPKLIETTSLQNFSYVAAVFFGFGVLISRALVEIGIEYKGGWQKTWSSKSEVPYQVVSYALASYSKLTGDENPSWKSNLPADVVEEYDLAIQYLQAHPDETTYFDKTAFENDLKARQHQVTARGFSKNKQFKDALTEYNLAISLATDKSLLTQLYLNAGYMQLMMENNEDSLAYFSKSLDLRPDYAYALANMGYIYTMTDQLEKAKECLDKVDACDNILQAYLLRDWALYYMKQGNNQLAEEYFRKAFDTGIKVDLLEYFYAKFLLSQSNSADATRYLAISVAKGERQGIELKKSLNE